MLTNQHEPAYPAGVFYGEQQIDCTAGLTKREYFAAIALQGVIARTMSPATHEYLAEQSVKIADALIAELNK